MTAQWLLLPPSPTMTPWPRESKTPGQASLPNAKGRAMATGLVFASCWCFGESLPLKTAGATAAANEG